jgi:hypothetical protein
VFYILTNFVSQGLLVVIFWELGTKDEDVSETTSEQIEVAEFDDDALLGMRIWNSFKRRQNHISQSQDSRPIPTSESMAIQSSPALLSTDEEPLHVSI